MDTQRQLQNSRLSIGALWICILGLLVIDQLTVRLSGLRLTDFYSWRYWANQITSAFFIFGLIVLLGSYLGALRRRGATRLLQLALLMNAIELSILFTLQSNHFLIYQKPFSSFSVRFVFENPALMGELAKENSVPIVENKPLARTIFKNIKLGHPIPKELYKAVAEVLAYVFKLKGLRRAT